jgi:hypothetical protein
MIQYLVQHILFNRKSLRRSSLYVRHVPIMQLDTLQNNSTNGLRNSSTASGAGSQPAAASQAAPLIAALFVHRILIQLPKQRTRSLRRLPLRH